MFDFKKLYLVLGAVVLLSGVFFLGKSSVDSKSDEKNTDSGQTKKALVYKSPTCGCCVGFTGFLKKDNYEVDMQVTEDMNAIKEKYGIPHNMQSCHTSIIEDYFVEGHVPLEAIDKLLAEKPDLDGIALPGMPSGSPGMPGLKTEEFVIYGIKDGEVSEFMKI